MEINKIEVIDPIVVSSLENILAEPLIKLIVTLVRKHTGLSIAELRVKNRKRHLVLARQWNMYFIAKHTTHSLSVIASIFDRDHATVVHSRKTINNLIETDKKMNNLYRKIEDEILLFKADGKETKYSVFKDLLQSTELDESQKREWIEKFTNSL